MGIESGSRLEQGVTASAHRTGQIGEKVRFETKRSGGGPGELRGSCPLPDGVSSAKVPTLSRSNKPFVDSVGESDPSNTRVGSRARTASGGASVNMKGHMHCPMLSFKLLPQGGP